MLYRYRVCLAAFASALFARAFERWSEIASHRLNFMRVGGIVVLRTVDDISSVPRVSVVLKGTSSPRLNRLSSRTGAVTFRRTRVDRACAMASTRGEVKGSRATARTTFLIKYGMGVRRDRTRSKIEVPRANSRGHFCFNRVVQSRFQLPSFIKNRSAAITHE